MSKRAGILLSVLCAVSVCLSAVSLSFALRSGSSETGDTQYVLYLGTNDKDTYEPVFSPEEAGQHADEVLTRHFEGFTIQEAKGGWTNEDGTVSHEYTLVIYLSDTTLEEVQAAADDLIQAFNQSSVLIQENQTRTTFYTGTNP